MTIRPDDLEHGVRTVRLPSGEAIPSLGQGTWGMAEDPRRRKDEIAALRLGFDLGMMLVDTAEMYADGGAEALVGEASAGRRDELFLVSKVLPENARTPGTTQRPRKLHWPGYCDMTVLWPFRRRPALPMCGKITLHSSSTSREKISPRSTARFPPPPRR